MNPESVQNPGGKSLRLLRPSIVVLCGPSACGKSTFAKRHFRPTQIISSDWARALVCDDERDQRFSTQAFALVQFLVEQRLTLNRLCVVDSTALTNQARKDLLNLAQRCQVPTTLLLFNVPLETCVARDEKRERSVGRAVLERQYENFERSKDAIRQEGFGQVVEFAEGDLESVQIEILFRPIQRPQRAEANSTRRFERVPQPYDRRAARDGDRVSSPSNGSRAPAAHPVIERRPVAPVASVTSPRVTAPTPAEAPAPVAATISDTTLKKVGTTSMAGRKEISS
jgi:protein phosphatase